MQDKDETYEFESESELLSASAVYKRSIENKRLIKLVTEVPIVEWGKLKMMYAQETIGLSQQERVGFRPFCSMILMKYANGELVEVKKDKWQEAQEKARQNV